MHGMRPAQACCREVIAIVNGKWECRPEQLKIDELYDQMGLGPVEHRLDNLGQALMFLYNKFLRQIEAKFDFQHFYQAPLTPGEARARPFVMTLGGYSTGKTSFIKHIIGQDYPGISIGPEPTTDKFVVVQYGAEKRSIPGDFLTVDQENMFTSIATASKSKVGSALHHLQGVTVKSEILREMSFLDTPGILSGGHHNERAYDFTELVQWFANRADLILFFFDVHKPDIPDQVKDVIRALGPNQQKVRFLLNRADSVDSVVLMRTYAGLMWGLGRVFTTPEVKRVYMGSYSVEEYNNISADVHPLFKRNLEILMGDFKALPKEAGIQKVQHLIRRVRLLKTHSALLDHLRSKMPWFWGHNKKQEKLIHTLEDVYGKVAAENSLPMGDFPDIAPMQELLQAIEFEDIKKLKDKDTKALNNLVEEHLPRLVAAVKHGFDTSQGYCQAWGWGTLLGADGEVSEDDDKFRLPETELETKDCVGRGVHLKVEHALAFQTDVHECKVTTPKEPPNGRVCVPKGEVQSWYPRNDITRVPRPECCGGYAMLVPATTQNNQAFFFHCLGALQGASCVQRGSGEFWRRKDLGSGCGSGLKCQKNGVCK